MSDRRNLLKIKLKSLASESKIIRDAENKLSLDHATDWPPHFVKRNSAKSTDPKEAKTLRVERARRRAAARAKPWYDENRGMLDELHAHRKLIVGPAARATHLAYGFLRGKTLGQLEGNRYWLRDLSPEERGGIQYHIDRPVYAAAMKMIYTYAGFVQRNEKQLEFQSWLLSTGFTNADSLPETEEQRLAREAKLREKSMNERLNPAPLLPPSFPIGP